MAIQDKIQQEKLNYIRLEHFLNVLRYSLAGSAADSFEIFYELLDKGLNLWFTESGYVFDEQKAFTGDVKCALIKIRKAWDELDSDDPTLFKKQIVKTQDDYEIAVGDLLINKHDVEQIYRLHGEDKYPWALVLWPQEDSDWQWFSVQQAGSSDFEHYFSKFASIGDLEREKRELELMSPNSLSERQYKASEMQRLNQKIRQLEDESGITNDRETRESILDSSISPLDKVTHAQYKAWAEETYWPQATAIKRLVSSQQSLHGVKRTAVLNLLACINYSRQNNDGLLPEVGEINRDGDSYLESHSWLLWCIDNEFYPGIDLLDAVIGLPKVDKSRLILCEISELESKLSHWELQSTNGLAEQEIKVRKVDELKQKIKHLQSVKDKSTSSNQVKTMSDSTQLVTTGLVPVVMKRLDRLKQFIELLEKAAKAKNIEIDVFQLPCTKQMLLDELKKRDKGKKLWNIKLSSFEKAWSHKNRSRICDNVNSSKQIQEDFFKNIF